jgi:hypothetical protein
MIPFPANIKRRIKVNCGGGVRQWPLWFMVVEKPAMRMEAPGRENKERFRICKNLQQSLFLPWNWASGGRFGEVDFLRGLLIWERVLG